MHEETIHLLSNAQPNLFPENRANHFKNRLVPSIPIVHGDQWEAGISVVNFINTLQTIPVDVSFSVGTLKDHPETISTVFTSSILPVKTDSPRGEQGKQGKQGEQGKQGKQGEQDKQDKQDKQGKQGEQGMFTRFNIPRGIYSEKTLMQCLNQNRQHGHNFHFSITTLAPHVHVVSVVVPPHCSMKLHPLLKDILGFKTDLLTSSQQATAPLNLNAFTYNILLYCNIVGYHYVGGMKTNCMCVIPYTGKDYGDSIHHEFQNVTYLPVKSQQVQDIEIKLMSDDGHPIPMTDGRSYVKMHLRRRAIK